ncbi:hypothetical protein GGI07_000544 [Coemansia sp. Benny D115]|nr:hypothetical protein GGI07_000544 [Coemansia sp. Benny D115]
MDAWRSCLPLLSVCMYWREALYPLVYQWVFFEPVVGAEPDDVSVISNIELIASANMCNALSLVRLKIPEIPLHNIYFEKLLRLLTPHMIRYLIEEYLPQLRLQLSKISFGMLENVTIDITLFNNKLEAYYSSVNALVDQMKNSRRSDLALDSHLSTIRLDLVKWDCLTSLSILGGMALHDSVKLLQRLPLLKRLEICGLEFDGYGINSYEYGKIGTGYGMFPLDSCIENLTIVNTFDHPFPAILHLLTLVSKVKVLQTDPKHIAELEQRIAHLGSQYPHLQNIKLLSI